MHQIEQSFCIHIVKYQTTLMMFLSQDGEYNHSGLFETNLGDVLSLSAASAQYCFKCDHSHPEAGTGASCTGKQCL